MTEPRLVSTWETLYKDNEGEGHVETLHKYEYPPEQVDIEELLVRQAPPIRITPSKAKPVNRDHTVYASIPDEQIGYRRIGERLEPIHDERALLATRLALKDIRPDVIVAQGDTIDMAELSRFAPDSNHFTQTLQHSIDRAGLWDAELAADHPNAQKIRLEGNHQRLMKFIMKNAMQVHGIKRAGGDTPVLSMSFLMRADETGWNYVTGYPANEFRAKDDLVFVHGDKVRSGGSTAEKMSKEYPDRNVVFGHVHRHELHTRTNHRGEQFMAATFGTLARIDGAVPSHGNGVDEYGEIVPRYEDWQNGFGIISDYNGVYVAEYVPIINGVAYYRGKSYGDQDG